MILISWRNVFLIAYVAVVIFALIMDLKARPIMGVAPADKAETKKLEETILQIIRKKIRARRRDFLPHVKISKSTLVRLLDKMEKEGRIEQVGERKQSFYKLM